MTDKELLEAAAKAAGIRLHHWTPDNEFVSVNETTDDDGPIWNPITSLADRYELARKCELTIDFESGEVNVRYALRSKVEQFRFTPSDDRSEAIAILQAAIASKGE
jgi:hypothetical protein